MNNTTPTEAKADATPATRADVAHLGDRVNRAFKWQDAAVILAILGGFLGGYGHLMSEATARAEDKISPLRARIDTLEQEQHRARTDVHEVQLDVRELYRSLRDGRRSERLEQPVPAVSPTTQPDGGIKQ